MKLFKTGRVERIESELDEDGRNMEWRKRQIILPEELVGKLFEWHNGQDSSVYALASCGMRDLVSLSMIDAAVQELELLHAQMKRKEREQAEDLEECIGELSGVRSFWKENSYKEAGMSLSDSEIEFDETDYDMEDESNVNTSSG